MPSGSHSGGGGSHFGGGSSDGSHFGGGSHSGSGHSVGPMIFMFGGRRYFVGGKARNIVSVLQTICVFVFIAIILSASTLSDSKQGIDKIEEDYAYYQSMISYAEAHNEYIVTGKVTGKFYNDDCDKWYITYSIKIDETSNLKGYTFSVYTLDEVSAFQIGNSIDIAVDSVPITLETDSIPLDYKDMPLSRDGEYVDFVSAKTKSIVALVIEVLALIGSIAGIVVVVLKNKQVVTDDKPESNTTSQTKEPTRCAYCGAIVDENENTCHSCGAKR